MFTSIEILGKLKDYWMWLVLRGVHYSNRFWRLKLFYLIRNPWHVDTPAQLHRFIETNQFILEHSGPVGSLLEVGCGEGHQSIYLKEICDRLTGLDISRRAVGRAHKRCPEGSFIIGDIFSAEAGSCAHYDLVVACEVLYYFKDLAAALKKFEELGHACLVTYMIREQERLDPIIQGMPDVEIETIQYQDRGWRIAYWPGSTRRRSRSNESGNH